MVLLLVTLTSINMCVIGFNSEIKLLKMSLLALVFCCLMACEKKSDEGANNQGNAPKITSSNVAIAAYNIVIEASVENANALELQINDGFGHAVVSSFDNLKYEGETIQITLDAKAENLIEGKLSYRLIASNAEEVTTISKTIDFLPFNQVDISMLFFDGSSSPKIAENNGANTSIRSIVENFPSIPLYVSASYNPLFLFYNNGLFTQRRLNDTNLSALSFSPNLEGDFLPSITTETKIFIPLSSGQVLSFGRDLSAAKLIETTFTGQLINFIVLNNAVALLYKDLAGNTFFELRNLDATLRIRDPEQINYETVFGDANGNLIFVQESEGGIFNFRSFNPNTNAFDIVGNTAPIIVSSKFNNNNQGLIFKGVQQGVSAIYSMQSPSYEPLRLLIDDAINIGVISNYNLFSGGLFYQNRGAFYNFCSSSSLGNRNLSLSIASSEIDIKLPVFIFPQ